MSVQPWGITRAGQKSHRLDQQKVESLCIALTRSPDRAHFWSLTDGPATPRVTATLHLGVLAREVPSTAAPNQSRETCPNPLVCREGEKKETHSEGVIIALLVRSQGPVPIGVSSCCLLS